MEDYGKTLKISFKTDSESLNDIKKQLKDLQEQGQIDIVGDEKKSKKLNSFVKDFAKQTDTLSGFMKPDGMSFGSFIQTKVIKGLANIFDSFVSEIKDTFSSAWEELDSMLGYSKLSSAQTRSLAFGYGFSASEAYAYEKTLGVMGLSSMEDLFYLNTQEQQKFNELFGKYTKRYSDLYDEGFFEDLQDYQYEMQTYKDDFEQVAMKIIIDNKDVILGFLKLGMEAFKIITKPVEWIDALIHIGDVGKMSSEAERISAIENYSNRTTNISMSNTYNVTGPDAQTIAANINRSPVEAIIAGIEGAMQ